MDQKPYIRLRQVCLATLDIRRDETALSRILGLKSCHSEILQDFGLENTLFAVNGTFIELVAPTRDNTAVHRFLKQKNGLGGYMAIFDCDDVSARKRAAEEIGIKPVFERKSAGAELLQLNPKQTGATLLEFDHHTGGDDMRGHYEWAGENWQRGIDTATTKDMISVTMSCQDPTARAAQWSALFGKPLKDKNSAPASLPLNYGTIHFTQAPPDTPDHFSTLQITAHDPVEMLERAEAEGCSMYENGFDFCGVETKIT